MRAGVCKGFGSHVWGSLVHVCCVSSADAFSTAKVILHDYMDEWGGESVTDTGW